MGIPIIIPCFNNHIYVANTIRQLEQINPQLVKLIIILNNSSTDPGTMEYLKNLKQIKIINNPNNGPWISPTKNPHIYAILPDKFILTDPDLEFNPNLPKDFIAQLSKLSDKYQVSRIGFAIKIDDFDKMYQYQDYLFGLNIYQWEEQNYYPETKITDNSEYELYRTGIDTTFCLINKKYVEKNSCIRVGGNFTCRHLPFYIQDDLLNIYEKYLYYSTSIKNLSTIAKLYKRYIEEHYNILEFDDEKILIKKTNNKMWLWNEIKNNTKNINRILNNILQNKKIFFELNTGVNKMSLYLSRKIKNIYQFEIDENAYYNLFNEIYKDNLNLENLHISFHNPNKVIIDIENKLKEFEQNNSIMLYIDIIGDEQNILSKLLEIVGVYKITCITKFYFSKWSQENFNKYNFLNKKLIEEQFNLGIFT